jgi:hypothetical protein
MSISTKPQGPVENRLLAALPDEVLARLLPALRQNLIPTPNASHWSHITPVNMLYPVISGFPKLLKLKMDEVLAKDRQVEGIGKGDIQGQVRFVAALFKVAA